MFEADRDAKRLLMIPTLHIHLLGDFLLASGDTAANVAVNSVSRAKSAAESTVIRDSPTWNRRDA